MSKLQKLIDKFYSKPVRNDMTYDEIEKIAKSFGCIVKSGGNHPIHVVHKESGTVIPIPRHGKTVGEAYIDELRELFDLIKAEREENQ